MFFIGVYNGSEVGVDRQEVRKMPKYDEKTGIISGMLFKEITDPCEICGGSENISFHAGIATREIFDKPTIIICKECWNRNYERRYQSPYPKEKS